MTIRTIFASAAALALAAGTPAVAAKSNQGDQAAGVSDSKAKGERKICRTFDASETRMKKTKLCLTRAQWKKFDYER
jgi:hypothetical protein